MMLFAVFSRCSFACMRHNACISPSKAERKASDEMGSAVFPGLTPLVSHTEALGEEDLAVEVVLLAHIVESIVDDAGQRP